MYRETPNGHLRRPSLERLDWGKLRNISARITCDLAETHERRSYKIKVRDSKIRGKWTAVHVRIAPGPSRLATYEGRTENHEQLFFLHANWEQQMKESAVVDRTSCCVILECLVTSIDCIT